MSTNGDVLPGRVFPHQQLLLEVERQTKSFEDRATHQHMRLTWDDKSSDIAIVVVEKHRQPSFPVTTHAVVSTKMKNTLDGSHLNVIDWILQLLKVLDVALKRSGAHQKGACTRVNHGAINTLSTLEILKNHMTMFIYGGGVCGHAFRVLSLGW